MSEIVSWGWTKAKIEDKQHTKIAVADEQPNLRPPTMLELLKTYREKESLSIGGLAKKAGISKTQLWRAEKGYSDLTTKTYQQLIDALGIPVESILQDRAEQQVVTEKYHTMSEVNAIIQTLPPKQRTSVIRLCWEIANSFGSKAPNQ